MSLPAHVRRMRLATLAAAALLLLAAGASAAAPTTDQNAPRHLLRPMPTTQADWQPVADALGRAGTLQAGTVYRVPASLVFNPDTQHSRIDTEFAGNLGNRATGIDHPMRSLNLVLGRVRPTLTSGHNGHLQQGHSPANSVSTLRGGTSPT